ncbi:hypothetical protein ATANTOWER_032084 [Ataeniobius toweri]|uniref:Uncharacterized protein n=1 Tax=Ataeniobius toweri TaxID=208326 RepID=A0ABU7AE64_9TELE|nr:hypothetical protein [Ataeniobius toweri]
MCRDIMWGEKVYLHYAGTNYWENRPRRPHAVEFRATDRPSLYYNYSLCYPGVEQEVQAAARSTHLHTSHVFLWLHSSFVTVLDPRIGIFGYAAPEMSSL